jgi:hypothetical protein
MTQLSGSVLGVLLSIAPFAPSKGVFIAPLSAGASMEIRHIQLDAEQPVDAPPSSRLQFDVHNTSPRAVKDIVVRIVMVRSRTADQPDTPRTRVAGPLDVRSSSELSPDYSVHFDIRLKNLGSDCDCEAVIDVLSARYVEEPDSGARIASVLNRR